MTFLYDIGNVVMKFDFAPAVAHFIERSTKEMTDPISEISDIKFSLEGGQMENEEFLARAMETFGYQGTKEEFIKAWNEIFSRNEPMWEAVEKFANAGHSLFVLSNTNGIHMDYLFTYDVFNHFTDGIYSHEVKCMKPDDQIYQMAIDKFSLDPANTIYIDDLPANAEAGIRLGFRTHQYDLKNHDAFLDFIAKQGVEI